MKALVIWWHSRLIVHTDGGIQSAVAPQPNAAAQTLVDLIKSDFPNVTTIRLLYLPADLEMEPAACPLGSRKAIQRALQHDKPALAANVAAWAAQPPIATEKAAMTHLSIERVPRLLRLRSMLEPLGVTIEAAFPILSWLERLPSFATRGNALAVLHSEDLALIYARDDQGGRHVYQFDDMAEDRTREIIGSQIAQATTTPTVSVVSLSTVDWAIAADPSPTLLHLDDFIGEAWNIPLRDPSNFLTPPSPIDPSLIATILGGALAVAALIFITWHEISIRRTQNEHRVKSEHLSSLTTELTQKTAYNASILEADSLTSDVGTTPKGINTLLQVLEQMLPREIDVTAIKITGDSFVLEGVAHESSALADTGPFFKFFDVMSDSSRPWKIVTKRPAAFTGSAWSLNGVFSK